MPTKMYAIRISLLLFLINLAFAYRLQRQADDLNTTSIVKEEITDLKDNEDNYQPWREWPNRLFPRYNTPKESDRPFWTIVTQSKTTMLPPTESLVKTTQLTPVNTASPIISSSPSIDSSSDFQSSLKPSFIPTASYDSDKTSSTYLPSISDAITNVHSPIIQSSLHTDHLQTSTITLTPSFSDFETTFPNLITITPSVPFSSISPIFDDSSLRSNQFSSFTSINRTDYDAISSTSSIYSTISSPESTVQFNQTDQPTPPTLTPPTTDINKPHVHKMVLTVPSEDIIVRTDKYEYRLMRLFELAYERMHNKSTTDLNVNILVMKPANKTFLDKDNKNMTELTLVYSVRLGAKYLNKEVIRQLLSKLTPKEINNMMSIKDQSQAEPSLGKLLTDKIFNLEEPYFWIFVGLVFFVMLICCFYFTMMVCWWKNKSKKSQFIASSFKDKKNLSPISPVHSDYSSDTLNTENFIKWRSKPDSKQKLNKRAKSLFKDDPKSSSLNKLTRRKEIGSSPSNEFEYISFSSDTTSSSLQRDGSMNKNSQVQQHPYNSQDYNRNSNLNQNYNRNYRNSELDLEKDYQQDYHTPIIERATTNQLNQPNSIKLLISRGIQSNLNTDDDYRHQTSIQQQAANKKFPLEIPFNSYYGNNVSVLNLSKEKLIPLSQYTSDSSSTTTSISKDDKQSKTRKQQQQSDSRFGTSKSDSRSNPGIDSRQNSRIDSSFESRANVQPKRVIKKEIIEEFETITTTTTFKNGNRNNSPNFSGIDVDVKIKDQTQINEQTKTIINAIRDELKRFNQQPTHIRQFDKLNK